MKIRLIWMVFFFLIACRSDNKVKQELPETETEPVAVIESNTEKEVVCFVYHRFGDDRFPTTNVTVNDFEAHLNWLAKRDYQVLTLVDAIEYLKSETPSRPTAVITIDDGYKSFFKNALPLLVKYNMPATLFINTETVGAGDYMNWSELKEASLKNIEIGNHTHSHAYFLNEKQNRRYGSFLNDIELSQKLIEENLNIKPTMFAYPYGEFDQELKTIVKALGFVGAAAQNSGVMNSAADRFQVPRFPMSEAYAKMFEEKALMKSFSVIHQSPYTSAIPRGKPKPMLTLTINTEGLKVDQMQCFVQGGSCKISVVEKTPTQMTLTLQATATITNRRRTLYTLTMPDSTGNWHWFSHLWVNPSVK